MENIFKGKKIIVTGGAGSIGSEIVGELLKHGPAQIRIFDNNEKALFFLNDELQNHENVRYLLGDTRDKERLGRAMHEIDFVFHAAALKHVPLCEYNPFEAIKTNVVGTQNVIETALDNDVKKVINISTDKAVNPINTMGATKLLAEKLVIAAQLFKGNNKTIFSSVRFGNVLGSNGSIVDLFNKQIKEKKAVTITDPQMTRFVMSINNAVQLILKAAEIMQGGEIFILEMPSLKIKDLAEAIVENSRHPKEIELHRIGIRPGEKMNESLLTEEEAEIALKAEKMYIVPPPKTKDFNFDYKKFGANQKLMSSEYKSEKQPLLKKEEIKKLLKSQN